MQNKGKKRVDVWREQYFVRRYLQHVSEEELGQRLRDIVNNSTILTADGRYAPRSSSEGGGYWMMKFTHILAEYELRGHCFPKKILQGINLPKSTYPIPPKSAMAIKEKKLEVSKYLIKYGKVEHLKAFFEKGIVRISPASFYKDPSLNHAIGDDELTLITYRLPQEVKMTFIDNRTGEEKGAILPISTITEYNKCKTDFYIFCSSMIYDHRLFEDFDNADACIIINNIGDFLRRIQYAAIKALPRWEMFNMPVTYIDPYNTQEEKYMPFFSKNFKYAYQFEYRFVWLPPSPKFKKKMDYLFLNIGSIKDIAELIVL